MSLVELKLKVGVRWITRTKAAAFNRDNRLLLPVSRNLKKKTVNILSNYTIAPDHAFVTDLRAR